MNNALLLLASCLGAFLFGVVSAFWGMVVPELEKKLGKAATILLANSLGLVVGSMVAGPLIDRAGNKLVLAAGVALVAAGIFGLGRVGSMASGFVMAIMIGAGGSAIVTAANTLVAEITTDATRGLWSNITNNFFAVGAFIAPIVLARLIAGGATLQRIGTLLAAMGGAVCVYYLLLGFPPARGAAAAAAAGDITGNPLLWVLAGMLFLYVGCEGTVWYWLNKYLTEHLKFSAQVAGATISGFALGIIAGRLVSSWLLGQNLLGPLPLTLAAGIALVISYTGLLLARAQGTVRALAVLAGVSMAPFFPTVLAATGTAFQTNVGTAIGLVVTGGWLGYVFIPPSIGYVADLRKGMFITSGAAALLVVLNVIALTLT